MPNSTPPDNNPTAPDVYRSPRDQGSSTSAAASLKGAASEAAAAFDNKRSTAADGLDAAASELHDRAGGLPGGDTVRSFARATADRLNAGADYVREHDARRMMADAERFVKSNPGPALVIAAVFGVLVGRALSRD
jgi:ElaB/YqjD/DUF883 family membrane-anchored ribosome-binding protein